MKPTLRIAIAFFITGLTLLISCKDPYKLKISPVHRGTMTSQMSSFIPYNATQQVSFLSSTGDTLKLTCTKLMVDVVSNDCRVGSNPPPCNEYHDDGIDVILKSLKADSSYLRINLTSQHDQSFYFEILKGANKGNPSSVYSTPNFALLDADSICTSSKTPSCIDNMMVNGKTYNHVIYLIDNRSSAISDTLFYTAANGIIKFKSSAEQTSWELIP